MKITFCQEYNYTSKCIELETEIYLETLDFGIFPIPLSHLVDGCNLTKSKASLPNDNEPASVLNTLNKLKN